MYDRLLTGDFMAEPARPPLPDRLMPDLLMKALNEPIPFRSSGMRFRLDGATEAVSMSGLLQLRWQPSPAVEFDGEIGASVPMSATTATLLLESPSAETEVILTHVSVGMDKSGLRCVLTSDVELVHDTALATRIRFYLVNFTDYVGDAVKRDNASDRGWFRGRLSFSTPDLACVVDSIPEVDELRKQASRDAGFVVTHVCELTLVRPCPHAEILPLLGELHLFFGFLRGAWAGPVLPRAYSESTLVWEQFAGWVVDDSREVGSWLPQRSFLSLSPLFEQFHRFAHSSEWSNALKTALSWYVAANASSVPHEVRLVLAQVALDLLASVELVEVRQIFQHEPFDRIGAARRIRHLMTHLRIPAGVPSHLKDLSAIATTLACDGPGVVVYIRNRLSHATEANRRDLDVVSPTQLWEAAQLSLQYVELALLALLGYNGKYAQRAWCGWKGSDEVAVPWA
jgi:hypothetical protein